MKKMNWTTRLYKIFDFGGTVHFCKCTNGERKPYGVKLRDPPVARLEISATTAIHGQHKLSI